MTIRRAAALACIALLLLFLPGTGLDARRAAPPDRLDDAAFWRMFTEFSEPDGAFRSENLVSNERTFPAVLPEVSRRASPSSAYIGVGPEQNFSYLAALTPRIAFIVDVRRQNAMLHLLYKAIFELAPNRAEFLSRLFSRPRARHIGPQSTARDMLEAFAVGRPSRDLFTANLDEITTLLTKRHGWPLGREDLASLTHVYESFFEIGPEIKYSMRSGRRGTPFPTFAQLMSATDERRTAGSFLASESPYLVVRDLQTRNLIVPVVGDFAGTRAVAAVGGFLRERGLSVAVFYTSNVEMYLFRNDAWRTFYRNLASLPISRDSVVVRSAFRGFGMGYPGTGFPDPGRAPGGPAGAAASGAEGRLWLDPIEPLLAAVQRGTITGYGDLLARMK
jgi:hypothetical protein